MQTEFRLPRHLQYRKEHYLTNMPNTWREKYKKSWTCPYRERLVIKPHRYEQAIVGETHAAGKTGQGNWTASPETHFLQTSQLVSHVTLLLRKQDRTLTAAGTNPWFPRLRSLNCPTRLYYISKACCRNRYATMSCSGITRRNKLSKRCICGLLFWDVMIGEMLMFLDADENEHTTIEFAYVLLIMIDSNS